MPTPSLGEPGLGLAAPPIFAPATLPLGLAAVAIDCLGLPLGLAPFEPDALPAPGPDLGLCLEVLRDA